MSNKPQASWDGAEVTIWLPPEAVAKLDMIVQNVRATQGYRYGSRKSVATKMVLRALTNLGDRLGDHLPGIAAFNHRVVLAIDALDKALTVEDVEAARSACDWLADQVESTRDALTRLTQAPRSDD
jgi:hypothetical protein